MWCRLFKEGEGLAFSKHSAVIAAFGQHFVHSGKVPKEFHRYLLEAMTIRHQGDYDERQTVGKTESERQLVSGEKFLKLAENLLGTIPPAEEENA